MIQLAFTLAFVLSLQVFSQDSKAAQTPATPLLASKNAAEQELADVNVKIQQIASQGNNFDLCEADRLNLIQQYDQWYLKNFEKLQQIEQEIETAITDTNLKLQTLMSERVALTPIEGQTSETVEITFSSLLDYFKNLNERLQGRSVQEQASVLKLQEKPAFNALHVSHSQIIKAMELMTKNLNASLKESKSTLVLDFSKTDTGFQVEAKTSLAHYSKAQLWTVPLLQGSANTIQLSSAEIFALISKSIPELDHYPIDGQLRYLKMQDQLRDHSCFESWRKIKSVASNTPFEGYEHTTADSSKSFLDWRKADLTTPVYGYLGKTHNRYYKFHLFSNRYQRHQSHRYNYSYKYSIQKDDPSATDLRSEGVQFSLFNNKESILTKHLIPITSQSGILGYAEQEATEFATQALYSCNTTHGYAIYTTRQYECRKKHPNSRIIGYILP